MNFVVNDQTPVTLIEDLEVWEFAVFLGTVGDDLIGGDRDGQAGVFVLCYENPA